MMQDIGGKARFRKTPLRPNGLLLAVILLLSIPLFSVLAVTTLQTNITPTDRFFTVQIASTPHLDATTWTLYVNGLVQRPLALTYENITALPSISFVAALKCVSGPSGTASWKGVRLKDVLDMAGPDANVTKVVFHGADGYSSDLTLAEATADDVMLAYGMNGETLPPEQGYPLKVVAPNNYGYKWVKWLVQIELVNTDYKGYWESRGWADDARYAAVSDWSVHAYLLSFAFILCGLSFVSGYGAGGNELVRTRLPAFLGKRFHAVASAAFFLVLLGTFLFWVFARYQAKGSAIDNSHGYLALVLVAIFSAASVTGIRGKKRTDLHSQISGVGFLIYIFVMATGFLLA
jgi:DMSO/TMAO reductase YedYZ molybdopterin-dependent catalytic subunit